MSLRCIAIIAMVPAVWSANASASAIPELIELTAAEQSQPVSAALAEAQDTFRSLLADGDHDAALESAKVVVGLTNQIWGNPSAQVGKALTNLAIAQVEIKDFAAAQTNFEAAIRAHEKADHSMVSEALINPLRGLANTQLALDDYEAAIPAIERVIHISHVMEGPTNLTQIDDMDALSRAYFFSGDDSVATSIQEKMYRLLQRKYPAQSEGYADALDRRARWFNEIGDFDRATLNLRRLERLLDKIYGKDDVRLIPTLLRLTFAANYQDNAPTNLSPEIADKHARHAIRRALRIARTHADDHPRLLALTLTKNGDFQQINNLERSAGKSYREALQVLAAHPELHPLRAEWFGEPTIIEEPPISPVYQRVVGIQATVSNPDRGFVIVTYDTDRAGHPLHLNVVDSEPAGLMDSQVLDRVRLFRHRPKFVDGVAVGAKGLTFRHDFRYDKRHLTDGEIRVIKRTQRKRAERAAEQQPASEPQAPASMPDETE